MPVINHGTVRGYKLGCRCEECTEANRKAKARERERRRERAGLPARTPNLALVPTKPSSGPIIEGPGAIEAAFRAALADPTDDALVRARREVVFAAARNMDNPKFAPYFKSAADVLRTTVEDLLAGKPPKDGEADALQTILDSFGGSKRGGRGPRGAPAVDDPAQPEQGDDRP